MNKIGFIRTIEAVIAVVLLLGFVLYIFSNNPKILTKTPDIVENTNKYILNEFLYNSSFRTCFSNTVGEGLCNKSSIYKIGNEKCSESINDFLLKSMPSGYHFSCEVCKTPKSCTNINIQSEKSVYPKSIFIYSDVFKEGRIIRNYIF